MFDFIMAVVLILFAFIVGFSSGENSTQISVQRIEIARELCGERGLDWVSLTVAKCKDGSLYQQYYKEFP